MELDLTSEWKGKCGLLRELGSEIYFVSLPSPKVGHPLLFK